jgi:hypothetical protein
VFARCRSLLSGCRTWFDDAHNLRRFAFWNILWWLCNQPPIAAWKFIDAASWASWGVWYTANISVAALWLASLSWWQATRVEEKQDTQEE